MSENASPGPTLLEALASGASGDNMQVYFIHVKCEYDKAATIARDLAVKDGVRWATVLRHPEMTVFAAAVVASVEDLETIRRSVRDMEGVLNPTAVLVEGGAYYDHEGDRHGHNGWP